jgi:alginate export protein
VIKPLRILFSEALMDAAAVAFRLKSSACVGLAVLLCLTAAPAVAQKRAGADVYQEQLRVRLDEQIPSAAEVGFEAGGWLNFALFHYDDAEAGMERTLRQYQMRAWASANIHGVHRFYVRGLLNWDEWGSGENPVPGRGDDFDSEVERLWYELDLGRLMQDASGEQPHWGARLKVGREFMTIGTALTLSLPLDMVQIRAHTPEWEFSMFLGNTVDDSQNIDNSLLVARRQDRLFFGAEVAYRGIPDHRLFTYFLGNWDDTTPHPRDPAQSYDYSSRYVGAGSEGVLVLPNLGYRAEVVGEWGRTYSEGVVHGQDRIRAMAVDFGLQYLVDCPSQPRFMFEYIYATGDSDRRLSSTSTVGGNRPGTRDNAFNAFGFRDTGIALAPQISNLHIYILGASFLPLEQIELCRKMEWGSKVFFYHKARAGGAISDTSATDDARGVGWEWDVFCNWRLTSDLAWTVRYGMFFPGSAYDSGDDSTRHFLYTGVTLSY